MEKEHIGKKGWHSSFSIYNVSLVGGICEKCKNPVKHGIVALHEECFNVFHRGNETQYTHLYHKDCSLDNNLWDKRDSAIKVNKSIIKRQKYLFEKIEKLNSDIESLDLKMMNEFPESEF